LALLVLVPAFAGRVNALPGPPITPTAVSQLLVVLSCLSLVLRRHYPPVVWALTLGAAIAVIMLQHGPSSALLPQLVALYTLATAWPVRRSLVAAAGSAAALLAAQAVATADPWDRATTYAVATWCVLATVVGISVRLQRRALAAARERARVAEESREEEAQRRVAQERLRIARELHDVVAHHVAVITVQAGVAEHLQVSDPAAAQDALRHVREASGQVLAEMSALLGVLRHGEEPGSEPARGLADLDELVGSLRRTGLQVVVRREGGPVPLDPLVDLTAYRIVEEALTNAYKHGAGTAQLLLAHRTGELTIEVTNPVPAAKTAAGHRDQGRGLVGMSERVAAVGGRLSARPGPNGTFLVRADLPVTTP